MHEPEMPGPKDTEPWHIVKPSVVYAFIAKFLAGGTRPAKYLALAINVGRALPGTTVLCRDCLHLKSG